MPDCRVEQPVDAPVEDVWAFLLTPERWPGTIPAIRSVTRSRFDGTDAVTDWQVEVGQSVLWWSGTERYDSSRRLMTFVAMGGDVDELNGEWMVIPDGRGCRLVLTMHFDLGVPSLARRIDPIAERTLTATLATIGMHIGSAVGAHQGGFQ